MNGVQRDADSRGLVADMLAQGAIVDEIPDGYRTLNKEMLSLAPLYRRIT
jgi:uncharacterized protein (DUF433 family)